MHVIRASTLADAHERAIKYILNTGREVVTEDGETTLQSQPMTLVVSNARGPGRLYGKVPFGKKFADEYSSSLLIGHHGKKSQFEYDYHGRLFHWCESANDIDQVDQVEYIIKKLSEQKTSRRAIATTWIPTIDEHTKDVPCLQFIQLWVEPGTTALNMCVAFRSNDFVLALGQNMYALTDLQNHIAERLQLCMGTYTHIAVIPHIYVIRDAGIIGDICEKGKYISPPRAQVCVHCMACDALDVCGTIQTIVRAFTRQ
jgi:thymidylate synthase